MEASPLLNKTMPTVPIAQGSKAEWIVPVKMKNLFNEPIRKFELWATRAGSKQLLWEISLDNREEKEGVLQIPKEYCHFEFTPPVYFLHYSVELEDGQRTTNNLTLHSDQTELSLRGHLGYAYHGWPNDDEAYLALFIEQE